MVGVCWKKCIFAAEKFDIVETQNLASLHPDIK